MIDSLKFLLLKEGQKKNYSYPNICLCGSLNDINNFKDEVISDISSILECNFYQRITEEHLSLSDCDGFNVLIYIVSQDTINTIFEDDDIFDIAPDHNLPVCYICMDEPSYKRIYYERFNHLVIGKSRLDKQSYLDILKTFFNSRLLNNETINLINDVFLFDNGNLKQDEINYLEGLSYLLGINNYFDYQKAYELLKESANQGNLDAIKALCYMHISLLDDFLNYRVGTFDYEYDEKIFANLLRNVQMDFSFENYYFLLAYLVYKSKESNDAYFNELYVGGAPDIAFDIFKKHIKELNPYLDVIYSYLVRLLTFQVRFTSLFKEKELVKKRLNDILSSLDLIKDPYLNKRSFIEIACGYILLSSNDNYQKYSLMVDKTIDAVLEFYNDDEVVKNHLLYFCHDALWSFKPNVISSIQTKKAVELFLNDAKNLVKLKPNVYNYEKLFKAYLSVAWYEGKLNVFDKEKEYFYQAFDFVISKVSDPKNEKLFLKAVREINDYLEEYDEYDGDLTRDDFSIIREKLINNINYKDLNNYPETLESLINLLRTHIYCLGFRNDANNVDNLIDQYLSLVMLQIDNNLFSYYNRAPLLDSLHSFESKAKRIKNNQRLQFLYQNHYQMFLKIGNAYFKIEDLFESGNTLIYLMYLKRDDNVTNFDIEFNELNKIGNLLNQISDDNMGNIYLLIKDILFDYFNNILPSQDLLNHAKLEIEKLYKIYQEQDFTYYLNYLNKIIDDLY